jgi:hypothetical protein
MGLLSNEAARVRKHQTHKDYAVPSIGVQRIESTELEIEGLVLIQFHTFARSATECRALRNEMLRVVHSDYHWTLGGIEMFSLYQGGRDHDDPDANTAYMSDDIEYHPYRVTETA